MEVEIKEEEEEPEVPSKYISYDTMLEVRCTVKYLDFEGLSDGKSVKTILQHVAPKKLVLHLQMV